jgi:hypothetical protein
MRFLRSCPVKPEEIRFDWFDRPVFRRLLAPPANQFSAAS